MTRDPILLLAIVSVVCTTIGYGGPLLTRLLS
jgi:hypothetical protein